MALRPYIVLMRPANLVTSAADVLAGVAITGVVLDQLTQTQIGSLLMLVLASVCLYGGGVVFNDVFDYELDAKERPERPIPSGQVSLKQAAIQAIFLYIVAILLASQVSFLSEMIAIAIAIMATTYDKWAKHHRFLGPVTMGICRGLNLLLGISFSTEALHTLWPIAGIPILFIMAITLTSQGEVVGNNKKAIALAMFMDVLVVASLIFLAIYHALDFTILIPFMLLWWGINLWAKFTAFQNNEPALIRRAVKMGVLSLIPLDACYAAGFNGLSMALIILFLLPVSVFLAKHFAVT